MAFLKPSTPPSPPVVLGILLTAAIVFFVGVSQLVQAFDRRQTRIAADLYRQGQAEMESGHAERAVDNFRAALSFRHANRDYQLDLARALRDTGRFDESESYLLHLWEQRPEDSEVDLALARLAVKRGSLQDALRYYHNAIYGQWPSDPDRSRHQARLELTQYLITQHAFTQAQSELIVLAPQEPKDADLHLRIAQMFYEAQDYPHALAEYQKLLRLQRSNPAALAGAGRSAFQIGHCRSAADYLEAALRSTTDPGLQDLLQLCRLALQYDPYARHISDAQRQGRLRAVLDVVAQRLTSCQPSNLADYDELKSRLDTLLPEMKRRRPADISDLADRVMDLVQDVEQQPCGAPTPSDRALLLVAQNPAGVDR